MYGFSYGCAKADVWHEFIDGAMIYPGNFVTGESCIHQPVLHRVHRRAQDDIASGKQLGRCPAEELGDARMSPSRVLHSAELCHLGASIPAQRTVPVLSCDATARGSVQIPQWCSTTVFSSKWRGRATSLTSTGHMASTRSSARRGRSHLSSMRPMATPAACSLTHPRLRHLRPR